MSIFSRTQAMPVPDVRRGFGGLSMLVKIGLVGIVIAILLVLVVSHSGVVSTAPDSHSVTVTAPNTQAPSMVLPQVNGTTQTELAVLASGSGWDSFWKTAALWLADRMFWPALLFLVLGGVLYALPLFPDEWGVRLGIGGVILLVTSLIAPVVAVLLAAAMDARNHALVQGIPPIAGGH